MKRVDRNFSGSRSLILLGMAIVLILTGCSKTREANWEVLWKKFYALNSLMEPSRVPVSEFRSAYNSEFYDLVSKDFAGMSYELDLIVSTFDTEMAYMTPVESKNVRNGLSYLKLLSKDLKAEILNIDQVASIGCPDKWIASEAAQIKRCGEINFRWSGLDSVSAPCAFVKASNYFENISQFDISKVKYISDLNETERKACTVFADSNRLNGHPKVIGFTWLPAKFQNDIDTDESYLALEVAEGLWSSTIGDQSNLETSVTASWAGYCAPYRKYERLLQEANLLLGSIKSGSCRN